MDNASIELTDTAPRRERTAGKAHRQGEFRIGSIYYMHPHLAGPPAAWPRFVNHAASLGFDSILLAPPFATGARQDVFRTANHDRLDPAIGGDAALPAIEDFARGTLAADLTPLLDLVLPALDPAAALVAGRPDWFVAATDESGPRFLTPTDPMVAWWDARIASLQAAGIRGFRCADAQDIPAPVWARLILAARARDPHVRFIGSTWGATPAMLAGLIGSGFDFTVSSSCFWDFRAPWLDDDHDRIGAVAPPIAVALAPMRDATLDRDNARQVAEWRRAIRFAVVLGAGWVLPMGVEYGRLTDFARPEARADEFAQLLDEADGILCAEVTAVNAWRTKSRPLFEGQFRRLSAPWTDVAIFARGTPQRPGLTIAANASADATAIIDPSSLMRGLDAGGRLAMLDHRMTLADDVPDSERNQECMEISADSARLPLSPAETLIFRPVMEPPVAQPVPRSQAVNDAVRAPRIAIEQVSPAVTDGPFAIKRVVGERITVEADLICDGHDHLAADLLFRAEDEAEWQRLPMHPLGNDRWQGQFPLARLGRHLFAIEAWRDRFGSFAEEISKKHAAGVDITLELIEGEALCSAAQHEGNESSPLLESLVAKLTKAEAEQKRRLLLDPATIALMRAHEERRFLSRLDPPCVIDADRRAAMFASWYEVFPRSQSFDETRHGNFDDVITQLPRIRAMGFDVLYFPPIHPIGRINRKGPNNTLTPAPDDPGSPYAIGAAEGGHDALHPGLGTLDDFRRLIEAAACEGIEIALDFAIQCSPDHPWLRAHPEWFDWRPDGSIKYAENPPKKYEDIVNVDFYAEGAKPSLWRALRDVVLFWAGQGVRIFRVDNPHTKPLPFWEWMIAEVRARHPGTIFLAEAFTRPKVMYRLAKIGFSQSYTYFTWRNSAAELREYIEELAHGPAREFFRPNFFVNTPDINPHYLQESGRAGFLIRAALAATLSGVWGVYNGFELCEADALPGREEYRDSEKYQLRNWDLDRPGNIISEITALNRIRTRNPALQDHRNIRFLPVADPDVLYFERADPDRTNVLLVAISTVPDRVIVTDIELPIWEFDLPDDGVLQAEDLMRGVAFAWHGKRQPLRLDPGELPFCIWRVRK